VVGAHKKGSQAFIPETLAATGGGDPLLIYATLVPKAAEIDVLSELDSAAAPAALVMFRAAYRNESHDKLPRTQWQEERSDLAWLPPCRPVKPTPFRDVWLVGKKELKWVYDSGRKR
jgi:hypothetical protein